jgi:hypothetical protein
MQWISQISQCAADSQLHVNLFQCSHIQFFFIGWRIWDATARLTLQSEIPGGDVPCQHHTQKHGRLQMQRIWAIKQICWRFLPNYLFNTWTSNLLIFPFQLFSFVPNQFRCVEFVVRFYLHILLCSQHIWSSAPSCAKHRKEGGWRHRSPATLRCLASLHNQHPSAWSLQVEQSCYICILVPFRSTD